MLFNAGALIDCRSDAYNHFTNASYVDFCETQKMQTRSINLRGSAGVLSSIETGESQFVICTETASDVRTAGLGGTERTGTSRIRNCPIGAKVG